jgi:cytochrome P450/nitrite reductase/ring-hydroxylating ferredoxin subunit
MSTAAPLTPFRRVATESELQGSGPFSANVDGVDVVLLRTPRGLSAFEGRCPHQGALLGEGELEGERLVCRNHRWKFDAATGKRDGGPQCLRSGPVEVSGGEVRVDVTALQQPAVTERAATRRIEDLPGPAALPLLGNALQLDPERLHLIFEQWAREYGPTYQFRLGTRRMLVISEQPMVQQTLRERPEIYRRWSNLEDVFGELGVHGVFSAEGSGWRPQRRLAMEALSVRHLKSFHPTLATVAQRLVKRWGAAADSGAVVDLNEDLKRFTVDVTSLLAFGHDSNTLERGHDVIQRKLELIFPAITRRITAVFPYWHYLKLPSDRRFERAVIELKDWMKGLLDAARAKAASRPPGQPPANFVEAMVDARDEHGAPFSDGLMMGNALQFLLAGEDTTAYSLAWTAHELCERPEVVKKLRAELNAQLSGALFPADHDAAQKLSYTGAVASEVMRLRPVATFLGLETCVPTRLGDFELEAGQRLVVLLRPMGLDPAHFDQPQELKPERWLQHNAAPVMKHDAGAQVPFGSGPRICPGRSLALVEMRVVLAALYKNFEVERVGRPEEVTEVFSFTMYPRGLKVKLKRR